MVSLITNNFDQGHIFLCNKRSLSLENSLCFEKPTTSSDAFVTSRKKSRNNGSTAPIWNVGRLPMVPECYVKARTSVVVRDSNPRCVADRILQCAKHLSADCSYDDEKAEATFNIHQTQFCVQLFFGSTLTTATTATPTSTTQSTIVVELRRKTGSPIIFHRVARTILSAAKGNPIIAPSTCFPTPNTTMIITAAGPSLRTKTTKQSVAAHRSEQNETSTVSNKDTLVENQNTEDTLKKIELLLKKDRVDANLLGMESLLNLTIRGLSSNRIVELAAHRIVNGGGDGTIQDTVFSLIRSSNITNNSSNNDHDNGYDTEDEEPKNVVQNAFQQRMRICALSLFSNSLNVLPLTNLRSNLTSSDWIGEDNGIVPFLIHQLDHSEELSGLQEAYLCAKCLQRLLEASKDLRLWAVEHGVCKVVRRCRDVGYETHALLGSASDGILRYLEGGVGASGGV